MRTIQMTLDDDLVKTVDKVARELKTTRSAFTRKALRDAINLFNAHLLEQKHRQGYNLHPVNKDEFSVWEKEQNWGDE
jgi:metal-responsive CopG/Arc/MetJ family transcriptional regulator